MVENDYTSPVSKEPKVQKPLTEGELRKLRKQYITRVLPTVQGCLHTIDPDIPPRNNCDNCWFVFFNADGNKIKELHEEYQADKEKLQSIWGKKFVTYFVRFMSTAVKLVKEEQNG